MTLSLYQARHLTALVRHLSPEELDRLAVDPAEPAWVRDFLPWFRKPAGGSSRVIVGATRTKIPSPRREPFSDVEHEMRAHEAYVLHERLGLSTGQIASRLYDSYVDDKKARDRVRRDVEEIARMLGLSFRPASPGRPPKPS